MGEAAAVTALLAAAGTFPKKSSVALPYLGLVGCGECGGAITGERQKGHHYYRCTRKVGPCSQKRFIREETLTEALRAGIWKVSIPREKGERMLAEVARWRREESGSRADQLGREKKALGKLESQLSRLLDVYLDSCVSHDDYAAKKQKILLERAVIRERMARIERQGSAWLEPMESFLKDAIQGGEPADSENIGDLRIFYGKIGSNLSLTEPKAEKTAVKRRTRPTEERACKSSCFPGGSAAPASENQDSGRSGRSQKSSSRYADRTFPALRIVHPNPRLLLARPRPRLKEWSLGDSNP